MSPSRVRRFVWIHLFVAAACLPASGQTKPAGQPALGSAKQPAAVPPAPQSKHYPILLIASGSEPFWSLRIGMKGAERLERAGYPPILLDAGAIEQEAAGQAWLYHAKDTATAADLTVRVSREPCSDNQSGAKYTFRVAVTHAQIGELQGCARVAPDQFPEFKQKNLDDDDPDKKKITSPPITNFKAPVAVAYLDAAGRVLVARGEIAKVVAPRGEQLSLSHDGKRLLFTREDHGSTDRTIVLYDSTTGKSADLLHGAVQSAFWSPDDSHVAFLKLVDGKWRVWTCPISAPEDAAQLFPEEVLTLEGWTDAHTVLAFNATRLLWIGDDGQTKETLNAKDLYGDVFGPSSANSFRLSPVNPDLLLISAAMGNPPPGTPADPHMGGNAGFFLYEIRSKRRVILSPPKMFAQSAEWSRDGLQIFFTAWDSSRNMAIFREFWDGSGLKKLRSGSNLVVGQ